MTEWILVNNTVVRECDVRRIEVDVVSGFGIFYNMTMHDGKVLRVAAGKPGSAWCHAIMSAAASAAASQTASHHDESEDEGEEDVS